jgi:hypothetical protein
MPITFLGCVYYPWAALTHIKWLQIGVLINPIVYMSEGLRAALTPGRGPCPLGGDQRKNSTRLLHVNPDASTVNGGASSALFLIRLHSSQIVTMVDFNLEARLILSLFCRD